MKFNLTTFLMSAIVCTSITGLEFKTSEKANDCSTHIAPHRSQADCLLARIGGEVSSRFDLRAVSSEKVPTQHALGGAFASRFSIFKTMHTKNTKKRTIVPQNQRTYLVRFTADELDSANFALASELSIGSGNLHYLHGLSRSREKINAKWDSLTKADKRYGYYKKGGPANGWRQSGDFQSTRGGDS